MKTILWHVSPFSQNSHNITSFHEVITRVQKYYFIITSMLFFIIPMFVIFIETSRWKQVMLLLVPMVLFPYVSTDYKLIYLFIPFFLFVITEEKDKYDKYYTILFGLLFIPKSYLHFSGPTFFSNPDKAILGLMSVIDIAAMVVFTIMIMRTGLINFLEKKINHGFWYRVTCKPL